VLRRHVLDQADRVAARLRAHRLRARTVVLKVKLHDFRIQTRRRTLDEPTSDGFRLGRIAAELLSTIPAGAAVRLTGVSGTNLVESDAPRQLALDEPQRARGEALGAALDEIEARFGRRAVKRATSLEDE